MSKQITITIADSVYQRIEAVMEHLKKTNKSEFCEELMRTGLDKFFSKP